MLGMEGWRAARQAEVFLIALGLDASALTSRCLFPCSVPALKPASALTRLGKLLLSPVSLLSKSGLTGSSREVQGAGRRELLAAAPGSPSRDVMPGGGKLPEPLLAAGSAPGCVCAGFLQLCSPRPGSCLPSLAFGAEELLGFSCQLGGGSMG